MEKELNENFCKYWNPFECNAIDKIMRKFKGHWKKGKVYSPDKPCKWELKYYAMVDGARFLIWFRLYRQTSEEDKAAATTEVETAKFDGSVTRALCNDAIDKLPKDMGQYKIYADNYYGGIELAKDIAARGFGFTFGCRANRPGWLFKHGLDEELATYSETKLENFACRVNEEEGIAAVSWKDQAQVRYLTNLHANDSVEVERRTHLLKIKIMETIPRVAADYTKNGMGHVDNFDQCMVSCGWEHKNACWRRTHFLTMLKMTLVNSWRFYLAQQSQEEGKPVRMTQKKFFGILKEELMEDWSREKDEATLVQV